MKTQKILSLIWIFLTVNFIFCDVFTLYQSEYLVQILNGKIGETEMTEEFLLIFSMIMEIPMVMILISAFANIRWSRPLNLIASLMLLFIQVGSLFIDDNSLHYCFFSLIEILACAFIFYKSLLWKREKN